MATVRDVVTRAFRKTGVLGAEMSLEAAQLSEGVDTLNSMIHAWKLEGADLAWSDQAESETFALGPEYVEGVVYMLASRLSPDYTVPQSFDADEWFRAIQSANVTITESTIPSVLVNLPSSLRRGSSVF